MNDVGFQPRSGDAPPSAWRPSSGSCTRVTPTPIPWSCPPGWWRPTAPVPACPRCGGTTRERIHWPICVWQVQRSAAHPSQLTDDPARPAPSGDAPPADAEGGHPPPAPWGSRARPSAAEAALPRATTAVLVNGARFYVDHAHPEYSSPEVLNPCDALVWDAPARWSPGAP